MQSWPAVRTAVCENRAFLGRAVRYLVALMLVAVLRFLVDADEPARVVAALLDALAPGSYLVASHVTPEHDPDGVGGLVRTYRQAGIPAQARTASEFAALAFGGLEMIDPGVVLVSQWRSSAGPRPLPAEVNWYGGIARKPGAPAQDHVIVDGYPL